MWFTLAHRGRSGAARRGEREGSHDGARTRWLVAAAATLALAVPVQAASAHRADFMFTGDVAKQVGAYQDGTSIFTQRAPDTPGSFTLVGHNPLESRGMNAAIAVNKGFVYAGSRTDGSNGRHAGRDHDRRRAQPGGSQDRGDDGAAAGGQPAGVLA